MLSRTQQLIVTQKVGDRVYQRVDENGYGEDPRILIRYFNSIYKSIHAQYGVDDFRRIEEKQITNLLKYISLWVEPAKLRRIKRSAVA
ncbi:MAG: hypothetical protein UGF45_13345 [Massilioclostridium sp.]|nr:hypothetical protein [Massilioclostridium sp.]